MPQDQNRGLVIVIAGLCALGFGSIIFLIVAASLALLK
jgi:hypothetical protein